MALGLFDRPSKASTMLMFPELYKVSQNKTDFNVMVLLEITYLNVIKNKI